MNTSPTIKNCENCGKIFIKAINLSKKNWEKTKFCSHKCSSDSILKYPLILKCIGCGNDFKRKTRDGQFRDYCSLKCYRKYFDRTKKTNHNPNRHSIETISCACGCGKEIKKYDRKGRLKKYVIGHTMKGLKRIFTPEWKEKIKKANIIKGKNSLGKNHWNWKGGITPANCLLRRGEEYDNWRKAVYKRDNWTCQKCKQKLKAGNIIAHHIKGFDEFKNLRFEIKNGITLCRSCHNKEHRLPK